jgi:2-polyprenyl-3-methyl-5-hydroxy-6-metoxy-1,4-benzoquinol methylase
MKANKDLKGHYETIYKNDEKNYFSKFIGGKDISETNEVVMRNLPEDLSNMVVVDIGCGEGFLIAEIAQKFECTAIGVDYSSTAINNAKERFSYQNLSFECVDIENFEKNVDVIISNGTLEHLKNPFEILSKYNDLLSSGGFIYITCPHFYNLRGLIWITLSKLLDVPMSLSDIHSITPMDVKRWAKDLNLSLEVIESYDHKRASGEIMINDMRKRLTNALSDARLSNNNVDQLLQFSLDFFEYQALYPKNIVLEGQNMLYILRKS